MDNPKILLAAPVSIVKEYCLFDWLEHIKNLTYLNLDFFFVDNSATPVNCEKIKELGFNCVWENPASKEARYFMATSMERCRVKFLAGDYDFLFSLECDIFPPLDIIERLLAHGQDLTSTTFWTDHGYSSKLQLRTIYELNRDPEKMIKDYKVRWLNFEEGQLFMNGKCKPMYATGMGCMLIKRWILEEVFFRIDPLEPGFADSFFALDVWERGIDNYVDTSIIPQHRNSNWNTIISDAGHKKLEIARGDTKLNDLTS